ncbi:hypothetical protein PACTADRAFT_49990 [Pachysolen tannophilus NRRL Y-2460]|uniref:Phosphatidylserine decarboxylase proenzyme 1, mitochondrial n=1 Tax=Pachysolen tannophilus NRRL Y-2460 TaxID=669874 RepID=A0A1E4TU20_PACTA|nr:hypothetical protein PACTADRAFT_49990 [Pachysolen tannophilus NRRL Y-2460]
MVLGTFYGVAPQSVKFQKNGYQKIIVNIHKRQYQKKVCGANQMNISKPLTRATEVANELDNYRYTYNFPKIPRPKRNILYYSSVNNTNKRLFSSLSKSEKLKFSRRFFSTNSNNNGNSKNGEQKQFQKSKKVFRNFFVISSISIVLYGIVSKIKKDNEKEEVDNGVRPTRNNSWKFYAYSTLPLKSISRLWGKFNDVELPIWLRVPGYKFYSMLFGVNLNEIREQDLTKFKNLGEFFYRDIKPEARPIEKNALLVSPCDGKILKLGIVDNGEIEQVKGMTYSVSSLLGINTKENKLAAPIQEVSFDNDNDDESLEHLKRDEEFANLNNISYTVDDLIGGGNFHFKEIEYKDEGDASIEKSSSTKIDKVNKELRDIDTDKVTKNSRGNLYFAVIYLSPGDYHRFHSPTNWVTTLRRHFVGELYSVAPYFQRTLSGLFILNERVALLGYWKYGFFSMTPVGATNVGSIKINFDKNLITNNIYENPTYPSLSTSSDSDISNTNSSVNNFKKVQKNTCYEATYSKASQLLGGKPLIKGEEVGGFKLGSTVVLVFEAPSNFKFNIENGDYVKVGQTIGDIVANSNQ